MRPRQRSEVLTLTVLSRLSLSLGGPHLRAPLTVAFSSPPLGLQSDLSVRLHGQHVARELVLTTVRGYLELPRPDKALALSFHGWSGTGKNFVARLLAENLYRDGLKSDCVKVFVTMFHFPHPKYVDLYKVSLQCWDEAGQPGAALCAARWPWSSLGVGFGHRGPFRQNL